MTTLVQANDVRADALETLDEIRLALHSWRFLRRLKSSSQEKRDQAAALMLDVAFARQSLAAAMLDDIVDDLRANEAELAEATQGVQEALRDLNRVSAVLDTITSYLGIVARIIAII